MTLLQKIKARLGGQQVRVKDTDPARAYDLWAYSYDEQPGNQMLALDEKIFTALTARLSLGGKDIVDVGCGTGRHWGYIRAQRPGSLTGYDISLGMLNRMKDKFPDARIHLIDDNNLTSTKDASCDVVVSTLTLAHIEHIEEALMEWHRILRDGGDVILTDYHPDALLQGGTHTFLHNGQTIAIRHYIHPIQHLRTLMQYAGFSIEAFTELRTDDTMKDHYETKPAQQVHEKTKAAPALYGMHLKKKHAIV